MRSLFYLFFWSLMAHHEKSDTNNPNYSSNILQNIDCLIQEALDAKEETIQANQKELLCWRSIEFTIKYKIGAKKIKGMIYADNLIKLLPPDLNEKHYANRLKK